MVLSDRSLRHTPLLPSLFAYREYFKAKSAKLQGVSGKFMILFIFAADNTLLFIAGNTIRKDCFHSVFFVSQFLTDLFPNRFPGNQLLNFISCLQVCLVHKSTDNGIAAGIQPVIPAVRSQ